MGVCPVVVVVRSKDTQLTHFDGGGRVDDVGSRSSSAKGSREGQEMGGGCLRAVHCRNGRSQDRTCSPPEAFRVV